MATLRCIFLCFDALVIEDSSYVQNWVIDFGTIFHATLHIGCFCTYAHICGIFRIYSKCELEILGVVDIKLTARLHTKLMLCTIKDVLKFIKILASPYQLDDLDYSITFGNGS